MAKHGANPLSGCLPILIQMPLFIGLNTVMRQSSLYIARIRDMYEYLAEKLLEIPALIGEDLSRGILWVIAEGRERRFRINENGAFVVDANGNFIPEAFVNPIVPPVWTENLEAVPVWLANNGLWETHTPADIQNAIDSVGGNVIMLSWPEHLARVVNKFTPDDWERVYASISDATQLNYIQDLVNDLSRIETFLGISIVESSGWGLPGVLIPILTGVSMFFSSWLMQQKNYDANADERAVMMQKMMLFVMPAMIAFFTVGLVAAVGVFWITGQIFQIITDVVLMKKANIPIRLPFQKPPPQVVDVIPVKKKK
jgi:YidC/Oxa1 family membrane protein insertase